MVVYLKVPLDQSAVPQNKVPGLLNKRWTVLTRDKMIRSHTELKTHGTSLAPSLCQTGGLSGCAVLGLIPRFAADAVNREFLGDVEVRGLREIYFDLIERKR
jgi:hypothetical protein